MSTNYGERPGIEHDGVHCACGNVVAENGKCVECAPASTPRTMSADSERIAREAALYDAQEGGRDPDALCFLSRRELGFVLAELDAERAAHAAERERHAATLEALEAVCDSDGGVVSMNEARALLAQARVSRGAK